MCCVYFVQFDQHSELQQQLLDTGDARIVFMCDGDNFLGSSYDANAAAANTYYGKNWLGKSLMKLRKQLQVLIYIHWFLFRIACTPSAFVS